VDLYLLHRDDPRQPLEPILETLTSLQQQGHMRAWGLSNWSHARIGALDALAGSAGVPSVAASSPHFSLVELVHTPWKGCLSIAGETHRAARTFYAQRQLPVLAWSPLGQGFLSPRTSDMAEMPCRHSYDNAANFGRKRRAETLARKYQVTAVQIALAYLFSQPFPVFAVVAARKVEHMQNNLAATRLQLPPAEVRWLEDGPE
jgi:aryl-alcohol dehydrogenase-like predicted oxidoreductase